jgi:hypothetical protein
MKRFFSRWYSLVALLVLSAATPSVWAGAGYTVLVLSDTPIGYWRLGEPQTTPIALDVTGGGRDGIYTRGVLSGQTGAIIGDPDTSALFDQNTAWVDIPTIGSDPFNLVNGFTLEAWVINAGQGGTPRSPLGRIVSNGWPGNIGYGWGILANDGMRFTTYGVFDYDSNTASVVPRDGAWHYVALVFDSTNTANFYVDGAFTEAISATNPVRPAALDLMIGRNPASTAEEFFNGGIDEVAIYSVELSAAQIQAHYNAGIAP